MRNDVALGIHCLRQCSATFFHSWDTKTLSKFLRHTSVQSEENLNAKSALIVLLLPPPKGKLDPTKSKSTATSRAPKPISKQPHIPQEMCYTFTQTEVVYMLSENIELENKNVPTLFWMDWCVIDVIANLSVLVSTLSHKLRCCTLG